jgi:hypothetical protein
MAPSRVENDVSPVASLAAVSSVATAPEGAAPGETRAAHEQRPSGLRANADKMVGLGLAGALIAVALLTTGGTDLGPNTWAQIVLVLTGAGVGVLVLLWGAPGRAWGLTTLLLFGAVAALTALSVAWSVKPDSSWVEANRTLSYVAAFGAALGLARLVPERWAGVVGGIALMTVVLSAVALVVKVFPETFDAAGTLGRLRQPLDYWNATGLIGALGLPACLWVGARLQTGRLLRALSVPAIAICATVVVLSYSRSALLAAVIGLVCWFALVPVRLRGVVVLSLGLAGGAVLTIWALLTHALTHNSVPLHARSSAGHTFGIVLVVVTAALIGVGLVAARSIDRASLAPVTRRRIGKWLVGVAVVVPVGVAAVGLASSSRGATGEISHVWHTLTSQKATVGNSASRIVDLASSRSLDWSEGMKVGEHALLKGVGAVGFATARLRYSSEPYVVQHAHSYAIETFADFGLIGIALNLALLLAWGVAAARPLRRGPPEDVRSGERAGLLTMLCVVVVFGAHSAIDWTWFVPGTALPALICAGWLAGRGPLSAPVGRLQHRRSLSRSPGVGAAVAGLAAIALIAAWVIWQPLRAAHADAAAVNAAIEGDTHAALADARAAVARNPLAVVPLWELSAVLDAAGDGPSARAELVKAVDLQPRNPDTWQQLGSYDLAHGLPGSALKEFQRAYAIHINSVQIIQLANRAQADLARHK